MLRYPILFFSLLALFEPVAAQQTPARWANYDNARFGFSLSYPSDLMEIERTSEAGDGVVFRTRDSEARLLVGALPNTGHYTPASYQQFVARNSYSDYQITYSPHGDSWFVLSGKNTDRIFYEKVVFSCGGRLINSFALIYPARQRDTFDRVVERVEASFRPGTKECQQGAGNFEAGTQRKTVGAHPRPRQRSEMADRIARQRGHDVLVILRRTSPPYDTKVVRGYASR